MLSAWLGKRGAFLAATFSAYTFALLYVFHSTEYGRYKMVPHLKHSNELDFQSNLFVSPNSSRESTTGNSILTKSHLSTVNSILTKRQETLSVKLNIKHIPRIESLFHSQTTSSFDKITYFRTRLQSVEIELIRRTVEVFDLITTTNKVDYMMYGGTLIGSYRHHGLVPWDDDVDVLVPLSAKSILYHAVKDFGSEFILNHDWSFCWKLFSVSADPIRGYNWRWPYVDIFFYDQNETHIWDIAPQYTNNFVYLKNTVFPLKRRPFMDLLLLAPFNPRAVIDINYDINLCKSGNWIHKWERYGFETSVPCYVLYFKFPFVQRTFQNGNCNESLIQNGRTISYFLNRDMRC